MGAEPSLAWRPRAVLLVGAGAVLVVLAVVTRSAVPLYLALPLLLAPLASALVAPRSSPTVGVELSAQGAGAEVRVRATVAVPDPVDPADLVVSLERPPGLVETAPPRVENTATGLEVESFWRSPEPSITIVDPPDVRWQDPIGLVERPAFVVAEPLVVERYPPEVIRAGAIPLRRTITLPGEHRSSRIGPSGEFHGIRPAFPSDPPRRINWRASARVGRWLANEFDLERAGDVVLFLDARPSSLGPALDDRLFGVARAAAAGIAQAFLKEKARVGLAVFGEFLTTVPLGLGRTHGRRIRTTLLNARLAAVRPPSERGAVAAGRYFPPGVTTIVISPLGDEIASEVVPHLRRRGYPVVVLSPSPIPLILESTAASVREDELVGRIARIVRRQRLARSWTYAPTIDWEEYWSLGGFVQFLRRPNVRRAG